jgi:uncharacterized protein YfkK (UPF0435 family)
MVKMRSLTDLQRLLQKKEDSLYKEWELTHEKLAQIRKERVLATDTNIKFKFNKDIEDLEDELSELERKLEEIRQKLNSIPDKPNFSPHVEKPTQNLTPPSLKRKGENSKPLSLQERGLERGFPDPVKSKTDEQATDVIVPVNDPSSLPTLPSPSSPTKNSGTENHIPDSSPSVEVGSESESSTPLPLLVSRELSDQQLTKLQDTLIDAFPTESSLKQLLSSLSSQLGKNLDDIARGDNLVTVILNLIERADTQGWVEGLIYTARELNPRNSRLRDTTQELLRNQSKSKEEQQQKILILVTIPHNWLLNKEIQEIEEVIRRTTNQDLFEICVRTAVCPQDIHQVVEKEQPQIVHLCGHGMKDGRLLLEDNEGNNKPLSPEGLASLFNLQNATVKCVLLNSCYSRLPAEAISQHINYVIGMNQSIKDKAAITFIQGFYNMLGAKTSENQDVFQRAFDKGLDTIQLENLSQESIPLLKKILLEQF